MRPKLCGPGLRRGDGLIGERPSTRAGSDRSSHRTGRCQRFPYPGERGGFGVLFAEQSESAVEREKAMAMDQRHQRARQRRRLSAPA